MYNGKTS